jgi:hypothetical protein
VTVYVPGGNLAVADVGAVGPDTNGMFIVGWPLIETS